MPLKQQFFALLVCIGVFLFTLDMVRRKRLREEYSVLWLLTSVSMFILVFKYEWLVALTRLIGAVLPTTTLFIGSLIFLTLIAVQFSIKISRLTDEMKNLTQENAILGHEVKALRQSLIGGKESGSFDPDQPDQHAGFPGDLFDRAEGLLEMMQPQNNAGGSAASLEAGAVRREEAQDDLARDDGI